MPDYLPIARFPLPDDLTPEGIVCAIVPIPDDPQFLETLTGLIDALRWSRNFARDATGIGASTVAKTWSKALDSAPIIIGDCMSIQLRQNPLNSCQLQQSNDGGETWSLAFDYSLCSEAISVPTPYAGSETQAEDSAAAIVRNLFEEVVNQVDCEMTRGAYIEATTNYIRTYDPSFANPAALGAVYDAACDMSPEELEDFQSDCAYTEKFEQLEGCYGETNLSDLLDCLNQLLVDWLNETNDSLMEALTQVASTITGDGYQRLAQGGAGGGSGFGADCEWEHIFDFEVEDGGFEAVSTGPCAPYASYSAGVGWVGIFGCMGFGYHEVRVFRNFTSAHITYLDCEVEFTGSGGSNKYGGGDLPSQPLPFDYDNDAGHIRLDCSSLLQVDPLASIYIKSCTIRGTGTNPFA
jgi:hypothetical protein